MLATAEQKGAERLEAFYRETTRKRVTAIVEKYAREWGLRVRVDPHHGGEQDALGSCSRQNSLNFSHRLAMVPPEALEYVVVHELAHTHRYDHSSGFLELFGGDASFLRNPTPLAKAKRAQTAGFLAFGLTFQFIPLGVKTLTLTRQAFNPDLIDFRDLQRAVCSELKKRHFIRRELFANTTQAH